MSVLEASGVSLAGRLHETSISLAAGEFACLVGPNGSGKTSLLHALAGIGRPTGKVRIGGFDPSTVPPAQRRRLFSYLPASRDIAWPLRVRDVIALGASAPQDMSRLPQITEDLELTQFEERRVDRLSTGERSRVLIARALLPQPRLLLLDEPTSNLDPLWQLRLMAYLRALARRGQALLVAVHDLELARDIANRILVMNEGHIEADGPPDDVLASKVVARVFGIERVEGRWRPLV